MQETECPPTTGRVEETRVNPDHLIAEILKNTDLEQADDSAESKSRKNELRILSHNLGLIFCFSFLFLLFRFRIAVVHSERRYGSVGQSRDEIPDVDGNAAI